MAFTKIDHIVFYLQILFYIFLFVVNENIIFSLPEEENLKKKSHVVKSEEEVTAA